MDNEAHGDDPYAKLAPRNPTVMTDKVERVAAIIRERTDATGDGVEQAAQEIVAANEPDEAMLDAGMKAFGDTQLVGSRFTRRALANTYTAMRQARVLG